ncbi:gallidermin/nisin family lantibiotic [Actinoplanes teichomyceticus]|uniref:Uncharacterized protein n=1 Tax=Actinoplanes teichomyceticus TaxID=1867 RepID=A0A561VM31_ACTTI|nr:gallidermin/nisin family lantibiotic [Actinoplanes teichomyceticus]TWG12647.1 hypothetical protein FHX34_105514 [Actinoplanes teichomyceticus]GIF13379.1 hypothetical protein Ate01nite_34110 [Actinoplanes teichomyceticus]
MPIDLFTQLPPADETIDDVFDLDVEVTVETTTSAIYHSGLICTPTCISPNGGSFCSFCC